MCDYNFPARTVVHGLNHRQLWDARRIIGFGHESEIANGARCMLVALLLLDRLTVAHAARLTNEVMCGGLDVTGSLLVGDYFVGLDTAKLAVLGRLLDSRSSFIVTSASSEPAFLWTVRQLKLSRVVVMGVDELDEFDSWMVVVGLASTRAKQLLLIDVRRQLLTLSAWNATMTKRHGYEMDDGRCVRICGAVAVGPRRIRHA